MATEARHAGPSSRSQSTAQTVFLRGISRVRHWTPPVPSTRRLALPIRAQINLLHEFAGGAADGENPWGDLIISGSTLYGMTQNGGSNDKGTIFSVQADGSGFTLLHEFAGSSFDGQYPLGSLIMSGTTLYGMTQNGGNNDRGTIFKIQTDGSGFTLLHAFAGDASVV